MIATLIKIVELLCNQNDKNALLSVKFLENNQDSVDYICRGSHGEVLYWKAVFSTYNCMKKFTLVKTFFWEFCKNFNNFWFKKHLKHYFKEPRDHLPWNLPLCSGLTNFRVNQETIIKQMCDFKKFRNFRFHRFHKLFHAFF